MDWILIGLVLGILAVSCAISTVLYFFIIKPKIAERITATNRPDDISKVTNAVYDRIQPFALITKIVIQTFIGFGLTVLIILKFSHHSVDFITNKPILNSNPNPNMTDILSKYVYNLPTLDIVGLALAYATAIELAYALFTDDLDEAITPLITGIAATILIIISRPNFNLDINSAIGIAIAVLALAGLFIIKNRLVKPTPPTP